MGELVSSGFFVHPLTLERGDSGVFSNLHSFLQILFLLRSVKPDILHLVTIKPVLYGGIAARFFSSTRVVAAISGLGYVFVGTTTIAHVRRLIIGLIYRLALGGRHLRLFFRTQ